LNPEKFMFTMQGIAAEFFSLVREMREYVLKSFFMYCLRVAFFLKKINKLKFKDIN